MAPRVYLLAENNPCGQCLTATVARGNAVIAELLRLAEFIPPVFRLANKLDQSKYGQLISDFSYFNATTAFENRIDEDQRLQDVDDEFRENYIEILTRFYLVFESVHKYALGINRLVEDLEEGMYIQQTVDSVLRDPDGKQLLAEMLYLYGVMLLVIDKKIDGVLRERMLVSFYRYSAQTSGMETGVDDVCRLMRSTGFAKGKRPPNYPEAFFSRVPINADFVDMVLGCLRSEDIYMQLPVYPLPDHRSTALSTQASLLYVCLYFAPETLRTKPAVMREIVDKYFPDNWIVSFYMGITHNLVEAWEPYKAAKSALANSLDAKNVSTVAQKHGSECLRLNNGLEQFLQEGTLAADYVLDNCNKLMATVRKCNVSLRWLMLHCAPLAPEFETLKKCRQLNDQVVSEIKCKLHDVFNLLLNSAQFELKLRELFKSMLSDRESTWAKLRDDSADRLSELSAVFSGATPLSRIPKNEKLQHWFDDTSKQIRQLDINDVFAASKKTIQLIKALEEVQEFHDLESHLHVKQFLEETRQQLHQMLRTLGMKDEALVQLETISDLSYAWEGIEIFTKLMQDGMKKDPFLAIKLRAVFLKLSSALDLPLLRIQLAQSPDLMSVSQFYSSELVLYVRKVLQVIPQTCFQLLSKIIDIQTSQMREIPSRLEKDKVKEFAQLDERFEVAKLTHSVSVLTEGILSMKTTLVGVVKVDPKQLLEDGVRKELVQRVATAMHHTLAFGQSAGTRVTVEGQLRILARQMDGFRRSFEYISDYIRMPGLKILQEELSRIINYSVERECNVFSRQKVQEWESVYQSKMVPIPNFPSADSQALTFVGRLASEVIRLTSPKSTAYVQQLTTWYDQKTKLECAGPQLWKTMMAGMGPIGMAGLDRYYSFLVRTTLERLGEDFRRDVHGSTESRQALVAGTEALKVSNQNVDSKLLPNLISKFAKPLAICVERILKIGHLQILRMSIVRELNSVARFESQMLENALQAFNMSVLSDITTKVKSMNENTSQDGNKLIYELTSYLDTCGITNPQNKIYCAWPALDSFPVFLCAAIVSVMPKLQHTPDLGLLSRRTGDALDGLPFVLGLATVSKHLVKGDQYQLLSQTVAYVKSILSSSLSSQNRSLEYPTEVLSFLSFWHLYVQFFPHSSKTLQSLMPDYILERFNDSSLTSKG